MVTIRFVGLLILRVKRFPKLTILLFRFSILPHSHLIFKFKHHKYGRILELRLFMKYFYSTVARDKCLKDWEFNESKGEEGIEISKEWGSGYPGDPVTKKFLRDNLDEV